MEINKIAHNLIDAGKKRADWFKPDAEVILAHSAKLIVDKSLKADRSMIELIRKFIKEREEHYYRMCDTYGIIAPTYKEPTFAEFVKWIEKQDKQ